MTYKASTVPPESPPEAIPGVLSTETRRKIDRLRARYPVARSALIPSLLIAQEEAGYLPAPVITEIGRIFGMHPNEVFDVASFYTMLFKKPVGRHVLAVCTNISCLLCNCEDVIGHIRKRLGIAPGETTADGRFTLMEVECLASCDTAPVMQVSNRSYYDNLTPEKVDQILDSLE